MLCALTMHRIRNHRFESSCVWVSVVTAVELVSGVWWWGVGVFLTFMTARVPKNAMKNRKKPTSSSSSLYTQSTVSRN